MNNTKKNKAGFHTVNTIDSLLTVKEAYKALFTYVIRYFKLIMIYISEQKR